MLLRKARESSLCLAICPTICPARCTKLKISVTTTFKLQKGKTEQSPLMCSKKQNPTHNKVHLGSPHMHSLTRQPQDEPSITSTCSQPSLAHCVPDNCLHSLTLITLLPSPCLYPQESLKAFRKETSTAFTSISVSPFETRRAVSSLHCLSQEAIRKYSIPGGIQDRDG